jgi:hypothetical protein
LVERYRDIGGQVQNHWWKGTEPLVDRYRIIGEHVDYHWWTTADRYVNNIGRQFH